MCHDVDGGVHSYALQATSADLLFLSLLGEDILFTWEHLILFEVGTKGIEIHFRSSSKLEDVYRIPRGTS